MAGGLRKFCTESPTTPSKANASPRKMPMVIMTYRNIQTLVIARPDSEAAGNNVHKPDQNDARVTSRDSRLQSPSGCPAPRIRE